MKKTLFLLLAMCTFSAQYGLAQQATKVFHDKTFVKENNQWKVYNAPDATYYPLEGNVISVKFKSGTTAASIESFLSTNHFTVIRKAIATGWYDLAVDADQDIFDRYDVCFNSALVAMTELPAMGKFEVMPNDPGSGSQWHLGKIQAFQAWDIATGSASVTVAVVDSGCELIHEDLGMGTDSYQNYFVNTADLQGDFLDNDGNGYVNDYKGWNFAQNNNNPVSTTNPHGTRVAGIISAKTNNNKGVSGIAGGWNGPGVKILPCKVGDADPIASVIDDAILYAADMGAKVIQLSLYVAYSPAINDAINYAVNVKGCMVVCASGNENEAVAFPANNIDVLAVGATTPTDSRAGFSNYGQALFIAAPGTTIYSTAAPYGSESGTSFAAPIVSAVIALMYSVSPCITPPQIKQILRETAEKVGGYTYDANGKSLELGYGRINAFLAVQKAQQTMPNTLDLYIKDAANDAGFEPDTSTNEMWNSPDIWVRNAADGGYEHQNPEYDTNNPNYIYVRVRNRSCVASSGTEKVKLYWAKASTSLTWSYNWVGNSFPNGGPLMGNIIGEVTIPALQPGQEAVLQCTWANVPNPANYTMPNMPDPWHFCLLARIEAVADPMEFAETTGLNSNVANNNNIAWKNLTVVDVEPNSGRLHGGTVMVSNPFNQPGKYNLVFKADDFETGGKIFEEAEVSVTLDANLYAAWTLGGNKGTSIKRTTDVRKVIITGDNASLDDVRFNANQIGYMDVGFNFLTEEVTQKQEYLYHAIQKNAIGNTILGGETYKIVRQPRQLFYAEAGNDREVNKNESVTLAATQLQEPAVYNWYDSSGTLLYEGPDFTLPAEIARKYKLEIISLSDGYKDYDEVEVTLKPDTIESVYPNPASEQITVVSKINNDGPAYLMLTNYYNPVITNNYILDSNDPDITINLSAYPSGTYYLTLMVNGAVADVKTIVKQ